MFPFIWEAAVEEAKKINILIPNSKKKNREKILQYQKSEFQ
jgi:signal recognition particle receptor subunit beta